MNAKSPCPCGSQCYYSDCCGLYIEQEEKPKTPEQLMRSRYSAYTQAKTDYIKKTMIGKALEGFNEFTAANWAKQINWLGLEVVKTYLDPQDENTGYVEFIARYQEQEKAQTIHELSQFKRLNEQWYYTTGTHIKPKKRPAKERIARNAPCPCGSQKKYKNCHGIK